MPIDRKNLPQLPVIASCVEAWCFLFFSLLFTYYLFASAYLTIFALAAIGGALYYFTIPPVGKAAIAKVLGEDPGGYKQFCHRGAGHDAPENTLAAFALAIKNGCYGIELDIMLTKDNIPIIYHDEEVDRTTNGKGRVDELTFEEIRKLDASVNHPYHSQYKGEKIPTLDEAVQECLKGKTKIIFDVKGGDPKYVEVVKELFVKYPELYDSSLVASFWPHFIYQLRSADPNIVTGLTWRPHFIAFQTLEGQQRFKSPIKNAVAHALDYVLEWAYHKWLWYVCGVSFVIVHKDCFSQQYVRYWKNQGLVPMCWPVNLPLEKEYWKTTFNAPIITDTMQ